MKMMNRSFPASLAFALAIAALTCAPAWAQKEPGTPSLNQEQAEAAARQNAENRASAEAHVAATEEYNAQMRQANAAQAAYEAEVARVQQAQAEYETAYAQWQADVAACRAGQRSRCAATAPAPR
jgi:hypothetical protein